MFQAGEDSLAVNLDVRSFDVFEEVDFRFAEERRAVGRRLGCRVGRGEVRGSACSLGDDGLRKFQSELFGQSQIQPNGFFGDVLHRDAGRAFPEQDSGDRFGDGKSRAVITESDASHRSALGDVWIVHEQRHFGVAGGLDHGVESLDDRVVALDVDGVHWAAGQRLRRLEHLGG